MKTKVFRGLALGAAALAMTIGLSTTSTEPAHAGKTPGIQNCTFERTSLEFWKPKYQTWYGNNDKRSCATWYFEWQRTGKCYPKLSWGCYPKGYEKLSNWWWS